MAAVDVMEHMRGAFRAEALDLLIELDSSLLALESAADDTSLVHRVFRAIHTIKGSGATAGCLHLAKFAHTMEEAFNLARDGRLPITPDLVDCGLKACDVIRLILDETTESFEARGEVEVTQAFARLLPAAAITAAESPIEPTASLPSRTAFHIVFRPGRSMFCLGTDPVTLIDELRLLGNTHSIAHAEQVPSLDALDPEHCYLWWEIGLVTESDRDAVKNVFVFVEDDCEVIIRRRDDQADAVAMLGCTPPGMFETFVEECEDQLACIREQALLLEKKPETGSCLDSLFRIVHSVKGNAALLLDVVSAQSQVEVTPLRLLVRISHRLESILDAWRGDTPEMAAETAVALSLEASDAMRKLLNFITRAEGECHVAAALLERLGIAPTHSNQATQTVADAAFQAFDNTATQCIATMTLCLDRMVERSQDAELRLATSAVYLRAIHTFQAAARYVEHAELTGLLEQQAKILSSHADNNLAWNEDERSQLADGLRSMRACMEAFSTDRQSSRATLAGPANTAKGPSPQHPDAVHRSKVDASRERRPADGTSPPAASTIRIDQAKLEGLMTIVGELLVARGAFPLLLEELQRHPELQHQLQSTAFTKNLKDAASSVSRIADELQRSVMSIRMLPVRTVFQKFPRLVRDLARSLGKEVNLVVAGETIELDKTIVEQIGDPLVHVIRNAVDHGLETPDQRVASGKDATGRLTLRAQHQAGGVSIEITDDGKGLDANALKRKAVEKGLLTGEAAAIMSDEAAYQLIFLPGLSTAARVTDVSGRGVGMDVVHSNVRNLQGTIEIRSRPGKGTTFLIRLPTSLMVSKGILLEAGGQPYILPLNSVCDMVKSAPAALHRHGTLALVSVRGSIYPAYLLAELLGLIPADSCELSIAIVEAGGTKFGLIVDRFLTEVEVLVKPLSGGLQNCEHFQGAAILGDGKVVLVLNALGCQPLEATNAVC